MPGGGCGATAQVLYLPHPIADHTQHHTPRVATTIAVAIARDLAKEINMGTPSSYGLEQHGLKPVQAVHWNLSPAELVEQAVRRGEGQLTQDGPIVVITKPHTGRSPNDKYIVREPSSADEIWWAKNGELSEEQFDRLHQRALQYLSERELFVRDLYACADPANRLRVRLIDEMAWTNLFANNLFIRPPAEDLPDFQPDFTILHAPELKADPATDKTRTETVITINFAKRVILIIGTRYAGEIKKSIFTILNYLLPQEGRVLHALFGQHRAEGRHGAVLWLVGHGQDDPQRRSQTRPDRRRRARLGR